MKALPAVHFKQEKRSKRSTFLWMMTFFCIFILQGCETKAGTGALAGGGVGAIIGGVAGGPEGALIGAGAGAVGGAIIGAAIDEDDKRKMRRETREKYEHGGRLSLKDIEDLHEKGFSDGKIKTMIDHTNSRYCDLTAKKINRLQKKGISDELINYMINTCRNQ